MPSKPKASALNVQDAIDSSLDKSSGSIGRKSKIDIWMEICPESYRQQVVDKVLKEGTYISHAKAARSLNILAIDFDLIDPPKISPDNVNCWREKQRPI